MWVNGEREIEVDGYVCVCVSGQVYLLHVYSFIFSARTHSLSLFLSLSVIDWPSKSSITRTPDHRSMDLAKHQIRAGEMAPPHKDTRTHTGMEKDKHTGGHTNTPWRYNMQM